LLTREEQTKHKLLPPPQFLPLDEPPPVIEPGFRDLAPLNVPQTMGEYEHFQSLPAKDELAKGLKNAASVALADEKVNSLLSNKRYIAIGPSIVQGKSQDGERDTSSIMVTFYNYVDNIAIVALLDKDANNVIKVEELYYQPAPVQQEIDEVISLAKNDPRLIEKLKEEMEGSAIVISSPDPKDKYYNHRLFDVRFGFADERLPRFRALVDLSTQNVLQAGPVCLDEMRRNEAKQ
jgi:hypothetical protein